MRTFEVHGIEIQAARDKLFNFVKNPANLPAWAHGFKSADEARARLETPAGAVDIRLRTDADSKTGTVDWTLQFPDRSIALAQSRVTETTRGTCIYSFVLHAPPVPARAGGRGARPAERHVAPGARGAEGADGGVMADGATLEDLARRAVGGDRDAVHGLVRALQSDVYALALRMLWHREDAEDATQEILVRVVTRLAQFDFRSRLQTWVYRVAANYLLDVKKSPIEKQRLRFDQFADDLAHGQSTAGPADRERSLLVEEVKIGCTLAMLQCLDRPHRLAYVLGEVLDLSAPEGAEALGVDPPAFRKRLQRSRERVESFTRRHCGLVSESATCQCNRRVPAAVELGRARPDSLQFAEAPTSFGEARDHVGRLDQARRAVELYRAGSPRASSINFAARVASALEASIEH